MRKNKFGSTYPKNKKTEPRRLKDNECEPFGEGNGIWTITDHGEDDDEIIGGFVACSDNFGEMK